MTIHFGQSAFSLQSGSGSSKTNSGKWGVANDNLFWAGENNRMVQKYMDPFATTWTRLTKSTAMQ